MPSGLLIIGPAEQAAIDEALALARAKPTPWEAAKAVAPTPTNVLLLKDREAGVEKLRRDYPPQNVMLGTYRAAVSFEHQPAGLFKHISVSSQAKDKVPGPEVMQMVCEAFGFSDKLCGAIGKAGATIIQSDLPVRIWLEEFEPGRMAINVVEAEPNA